IGEAPPVGESGVAVGLGEDHAGRVGVLGQAKVQAERRARGGGRIGGGERGRPSRWVAGKPTRGASACSARPRSRPNVGRVGTGASKKWIGKFEPMPPPGNQARSAV